MYGSACGDDGSILAIALFEMTGAPNNIKPLKKACWHNLIAHDIQKELVSRRGGDQSITSGSISKNGIIRSVVAMGAIRTNVFTDISLEQVERRVITVQDDLPGCVIGKFLPNRVC